MKFTNKSLFYLIQIVFIVTCFFMPNWLSPEWEPDPTFLDIILVITMILGALLTFIWIVLFLLNLLKDDIKFEINISAPFKERRQRRKEGQKQLNKVNDEIINAKNNVELDIALKKKDNLLCH